MAMDTYVENRDIVKHSQYLSSQLFNRSLSAEERECEAFTVTVTAI